MVIISETLKLDQCNSTSQVSAPSRPWQLRICTTLFSCTIFFTHQHLCRPSPAGLLRTTTTLFSSINIYFFNPNNNFTCHLSATSPPFVKNKKNALISQSVFQSIYFLSAFAPLRSNLHHILDTWYSVKNQFAVYIFWGKRTNILWNIFFRLWNISTLDSKSAIKKIGSCGISLLSETLWRQCTFERTEQTRNLFTYFDN